MKKFIIIYLEKNYTIFILRNITLFHFILNFYIILKTRIDNFLNKKKKKNNGFDVIKSNFISFFNI